jgi:hypothetical protein
MKFCQNIIKTQLNSKTFVLIICLLSQWSKLTQSIPPNVKNFRDFDYNLSSLRIKCDPNEDHIKPCPQPRTYCSKEVGVCQCIPNYPIPITEAGDCLD